MPLIRYQASDERPKRQKRPGPKGAYERVQETYQIGKGYQCAECATYHGYTTATTCWVCEAPIIDPPVRPAALDALARDIRRGSAASGSI